MDHYDDLELELEDDFAGELGDIEDDTEFADDAFEDDNEFEDDDGAFESENDFEDDFEDEFEDDLEDLEDFDDHEDDEGEFLGGLFKTLAPMAAKLIGSVLGGAGGQREAIPVARAVIEDDDSEWESDDEGEEAYESEDGEAFELMLEASEQFADGELGIHSLRRRITLLAHRAFRRWPRARHQIPLVVMAAVRLAWRLRRNPRTRWAVRLVPTIVWRTLRRLRRFRHLSRRLLIRVMSREAARVLASRGHARWGLRYRPGHRRWRSSSSRHPYLSPHRLHRHHGYPRRRSTYQQPYSKPRSSRPRWRRRCRNC